MYISCSDFFVSILRFFTVCAVKRFKNCNAKLDHALCMVQFCIAIFEYTIEGVQFHCLPLHYPLSLLGIGSVCFVIVVFLAHLH